MTMDIPWVWIAAGGVGYWLYTSKNAPDEAAKATVAAQTPVQATVNKAIEVVNDVYAQLKGLGGVRGQGMRGLGATLTAEMAKSNPAMACPEGCMGAGSLEQIGACVDQCMGQKGGPPVTPLTPSILTPVSPLSVNPSWFEGKTLGVDNKVVTAGALILGYFYAKKHKMFGLGGLGCNSCGC